MFLNKYLYKWCSVLNYFYIKLKPLICPTIPPNFMKIVPAIIEQYAPIAFDWNIALHLICVPGTRGHLTISWRKTCQRMVKLHSLFKPSGRSTDWGNVMPLKVENYTLGNFSRHFPTRASEMPPCTQDTDTFRVVHFQCNWFLVMVVSHWRILGCDKGRMRKS